MVRAAERIDCDQVVHLRVPWETYKAVSMGGGDDRSPRLAYDGETLEIISPGSKHERIAVRIAYLLSSVVTEWDFNIENTGSTTFESEPRGFEGDDSYYIANASKVADWDNISLATDPPPDLVIEVDISNRRFGKKQRYAKVGIPEFWRYDEKRDSKHSPLSKARISRLIGVWLSQAYRLRNSTNGSYAKQTAAQSLKNGSSGCAQIMLSNSRKSRDGKAKSVGHESNSADR